MLICLNVNEALTMTETTQVVSHAVLAIMILNNSLLILQQHVKVASIKQYNVCVDWLNHTSFN